MRNIINIVKQKLKVSNERSLKIRNNIILAFLFKGGSMLVNLALVPIIITFVNTTEYGIWLALSSVIAWFGISDIGFGHGLRNKFAEAIAVGNKELARSYVSTTYITLFIFSSVVWIIFFIVNHFLDWTLILNANNISKDELSKVVLIVFTFFSLQFVLKLITTILTAYQEAGKASGFDFLANFFILINIYILIKLNVDGSLKTLALLTGAYQLGILILASLFFYNKELKEYRPSVKFFNKQQIRSLMGLGVRFFIIQITMIFIYQSTNIIITQVLDPDSVTEYNIAYRYFSIPLTIAIIIISPLWSAFTDAYVKKDYMWMKKIFKQLIFLSIFISLILISFFLISDFSYKIWLKDKVIVSVSVSFFMMLNVICLTITSIFITLLNGAGKLKVQLIVNTIIALIFIPLAILLGKQYGLAGIIAASFIVNLIYAILAPIHCYKIINNTATGIWNK